MKDLLDGELDNTMKETLKKLEEYSKSLGQDIDSSDEKIFADMGLDLEELEKLQTAAFSDLDNSIEIQYVNNSKLEDPKYNHKEDSGFDIRANIKDNVTISSLGRVLVPTGLHFKIHEDYELQIRPRSGLAAKHGITVLNTPGTVDSNYRGEIKIILINLGEDPFTINDGDRVAQGVLNNILNTNWAKYIKVSKLESTKRDSGGFGSTGIK